MTRIPGASSGPSQPTSCGAPRQRREARVRLKASAPPTLTAAATITAAAGETSAMIARAIAGALITDTSKTIETSA